MENDKVFTTATIDRSTWKPLLELSAKEVFDIMVGTQLKNPESDVKVRSEFTAMVGLAGSICGVLSIRCTKVAARVMAARMLGLTPEEVDDDSWDALGEIANMVAGNFKAKLSGIGNHCMLSVPTIINGSDYAMHSLADGDVLEGVMQFDEHKVSVTLELHS